MTEPFYTCCEDGMLSQVPPTDRSGLCPACRPQGGMRRRTMSRILDFFWSQCPSGLPHRTRWGVVTNIFGKPYCWHRDCMRANFKECGVTTDGVKGLGDA